ncbi:hypothetical protein [Sphingomonas canadensis]|uniref:hypothetical protein n=1 Tax=Sphingomonas canadensis TaxID=1219257 RepID=UPI002232B04D|nr:hypothetical protein [Sphingomonas canadensis]
MGFGLADRLRRGGEWGLGGKRQEGQGVSHRCAASYASAPRRETAFRERAGAARADIQSPFTVHNASR